MAIWHSLNSHARALAATFVILLAALAIVFGLVHQSSNPGRDGKSSSHLTSLTSRPSAAPRPAASMAEAMADRVVAPAVAVGDGAPGIASEPAQIVESRSVARPRLVRVRTREAEAATVRSSPVAAPQVAIAFAPAAPTLSAPVVAVPGVPEAGRIAEPVEHPAQTAAVAVAQPASLSLEHTPAVLQDPVASQPELTADPLVVQGEVHPLSNQDLASVGAASGNGVTAAASPGEPLS